VRSFLYARREGYSVSAGIRPLKKDSKKPPAGGFSLFLAFFPPGVVQ